VTSPTIPLHLGVALGDDDVKVRIENPTDETVRVWVLGNSWGGASWALRLRVDGSDGRTFMLRPTNQGYTRNVPRFIAVAARGEHEIRLTPTGREWTAGEDLASLKTAKVHVQAVLDIASSPEAIEHDVAVGHVESAEVLSLPPHRWLFGGAP
jgi:hypothetical protein